MVKNDNMLSRNLYRVRSDEVEESIVVVGVAWCGKLILCVIIINIINNNNDDDDDDG